jgi:hypothetical protein
MFKNARNFNQPLNRWKLSKVINTESMFCKAIEFNQPLNSWDVSKVEIMSHMFDGTEKFNQDLNDWDTRKVFTMKAMFKNSGFNKTLSKWETGNVINMISMFENAVNFKGKVKFWDMKNVRTISKMFSGAIQFDENITPWKLDKCTDQTNIFYNSGIKSNNSYNLSVPTPKKQEFYKEYEVTPFNNGSLPLYLNLWLSNKKSPEFTIPYHEPYYGNIENWNVSNVTNIDNLFHSKFDFNENISSWDVSNVVSMENTFFKAIIFNKPLNSWNVEKVQNMKGMFSEAVSFNQQLNNWKVSNVTNMASMFFKADSFNQDLSLWDVENVLDFSNMFNQALSFDQDISLWKPKNDNSVVNMTGMFYKCQYTFERFKDFIGFGVTPTMTFFYPPPTSQEISDNYCKFAELYPDAPEFCPVPKVKGLYEPTQDQVYLDCVTGKKNNSRGITTTKGCAINKKLPGTLGNPNSISAKRRQGEVITANNTRSGKTRYVFNSGDSGERYGQPGGITPPIRNRF